MKLKVAAKLDAGFAPMALVCREMREGTANGGQDLIIAAERNKGYTLVYKTRIYKDGTGHDEENCKYVDRIAKTLLWVSGGYKLYIAGSAVVGEYIKNTFCYGGTRDFDVRFMERV
ncbi:MAG: ROK family protein, partial [Clostridia bacterium]|nr:ROK family protein [Clostridia bacterium]